MFGVPFPVVAFSLPAQDKDRQCPHWNNSSSCAALGILFAPDFLYKESLRRWTQIFVNFLWGIAYIVKHLQAMIQLDNSCWDLGEAVLARPPETGLSVFLHAESSGTWLCPPPSAPGSRRWSRRCALGIALSLQAVKCSSFQVWISFCFILF